MTFEQQGGVKISTKTYTAWGANIRGTPRMAAREVAQDLKILKKSGEVGVMQEFVHSYYWRLAHRLFVKATAGAWGTSPGSLRSYAHPVEGAQAVFWDRTVWKRIKVRKLLLHRGVTGVSQDRYLRAVLLEDRETGLRCWFGTTHFVVGGDNDSDERLRRDMLEANIKKLSRFLRQLQLTGDPIWFELDANIGKNSDAYDRFRTMLKKHGAMIHGEHGVEYVFTIGGYENVIVVESNSRIRPKRYGGKMNTDHEVRLTKFHLAEK